MKKEIGITLIALAVVIGVIIILAGVALTASLGQNGTIEKSKDAVNIYRNVENDYYEKIDIIESQLEDLDDEKNGI